MTFAVQADVLDINRNVAVASDRLWVDTTVWLKIAYSRTSVSESRPYAAFVGQAMRIGAALFTGPVNLAEVAKHVESSELDLWMVRNGDTRQHRVVLKIFREDTAERANVISEIENTWRQMLNLAVLPVVPVERACVTEIVSRLHAGEFLDGADAIQMAEARRNGIAQVLTHDRDFASVPGMSVFTGLRSVIELARTAGRLVER